MGGKMSDLGNCGDVCIASCGTTLRSFPTRAYTKVAISLYVSARPEKPDGNAFIKSERSEVLTHDSDQFPVHRQLR